MNFLIKLLVTGIVTYALGYVLPGVHFGGIGTAIWFVLMLGLMNAIVKPVLKIIGFPVTVLTLGLFLLVINVVVIQLADLLTPGDNVRGFIWSILFAFILSLVTTIIDKMFDNDVKAA